MSGFQIVDPIVAVAALNRELERRLSAVEQSAGFQQRALSLRSVRPQVARTLRHHRGDRGGASATAGQLCQRGVAGQRSVQGWVC